MDQILESGHKNLKLSKQTKLQSNVKFELFVQHIINKMKEKNPLFKEIFSRWALAGSCFDDLKIVKPNEYDINLIMSIDFLKNILITPSFTNGYCRIQIQDLEQFKTIKLSIPAKNSFKKLIDIDGYILQNKFHGYMEKVITIALNNIKGTSFVDPNLQGTSSVDPNLPGTSSVELNLNGTIFVIDKLTKSGPAHTLKLRIKDTDIKFDIDFVVALEFSENKAITILPKINFENKNWLAIPKPRKLRKKPKFSRQILEGENKVNLPVPRFQDNNRAWICSYIQYEKIILKHNQKAKPLIRIFKKIRDTANIPNLKSFFIKNIFLLEIQKQNKNFFGENSLQLLFMHMLGVIIKNFEEKKIQFFWDTSFNLLGKFNNSQINVIYNQLSNIKREIEQERIQKKFDCLANLLKVKDLEESTFII